jgi:glycosyltransferase involved in cell wall biosynthesis
MRWVRLIICRLSINTIVGSVAAAPVAALSPLLAEQWSARSRFEISFSSTSNHQDCDVLALPALLPLSDKQETIFGYGTIEVGKGPFVLADAVAQLRKTRNDTLVRVAGIGPAMQMVKARVRELGIDRSWEFVGSYQGTVGCSAFVRTLDVFVLPSYAEGTSKSVIEAMAHGIPIITTTVGGLPDLLAKEAGILVPAGDSSALADAMHLLASDSMLRAQMGKAARERYLRLFAPDAVLPMLLTTYLRLVGAPPSVLQTAIIPGL